MGIAAGALAQHAHAESGGVGRGIGLAAPHDSVARRADRSLREKIARTASLWGSLRSSETSVTRERPTLAFRVVVFCLEQLPSPQSSCIRRRRSPFANVVIVGASATAPKSAAPSSNPAGIGEPTRTRKSAGTGVERRALGTSTTTGRLPLTAEAPFTPVHVKDRG
jgi:hypothetical protein